MLEMTINSHTEELNFLITSVASPPLILGYLWLTQLCRPINTEREPPKHQYVEIDLSNIYITLFIMIHKNKKW